MSEVQKEDSTAAVLDTPVVPPAILTGLSLFHIVSDVVKNLHDKGFQNVMKNSLTYIKAKVESGHLKQELLDAAEGALVEIVTAHPDVQNSQGGKEDIGYGPGQPAPRPISVPTARIAVGLASPSVPQPVVTADTIDYDKLADALLRAQKRQEKKHVA